MKNFKWKSTNFQLSYFLILAIFFVGLPNNSKAQVVVVVNNGAISGTVTIKKSAVKDTKTFVKKLKANIRLYKYNIQKHKASNGFVPKKNYISEKYQKSIKPKNLTCQLKSTGRDSYTFEYQIFKLPYELNYAVSIKRISDENVYFESKMKGFATVYLTSCNRYFKCYNFEGKYDKPPH